MRALLLHPKIAARPCSSCRQYLYRDGGNGTWGELVTIRPSGRPAPRPKGTRPPCDVCPKIAPGDGPRPENGHDLSDKNLQAYLFHMECRAVGQWPNDPIVRRNAALIEAALKVADAVRAQSGMQLALAPLAALME